MGSVLYQANHDQYHRQPESYSELGAKAGISYIAEDGASVSLFMPIRVTLEGMPYPSTPAGSVSFGERSRAFD